MTAQFLSPLRVEQIGDRRWILIDDLVFQSKQHNGIFIAPFGFQTDFASIPRFAWTYFPPMGIHNAAAVMHDAAYGNALVTETRLRVFLIKKFCDDLFAESLRALGVRGVQYRIMVRAVRISGDPLGHPLSAHYRPGQIKSGQIKSNE